MTPIAPLISAFLKQHLAVERRASIHTSDSYSYAFQLLFVFLSRKYKTQPSKLALEQVDAKNIASFLDHLERKRRNSDRTCNARLAAIKSFMSFIEYRVPSALAQVQQIQAMPSKRTDTTLVPHLNAEEHRALLEVPDVATRLGARDRAMILLSITGGLRVSELVGIRLDDVEFRDRRLQIRIRGKGRRERTLILWKSVADVIRGWMAVRGNAPAPELFLNAWRRPITRSGFDDVLKRHVAVAAERCPSLKSKRVSPHVLRHTCAVNTLRATRDIRQVALWLGHASIQSTEVYLQADPTEKLEALAAMKAPGLRPGKFRVSDRLIAELQSATLCGVRAGDTAAMPRAKASRPRERCT